MRRRSFRLPVEPRGEATIPSPCSLQEVPNSPGFRASAHMHLRRRDFAAPVLACNLHSERAAHAYGVKQKAICQLGFLTVDYPPHTAQSQQGWRRKSERWFLRRCAHHGPTSAWPTSQVSRQVLRLGVRALLASSKPLEKAGRNKEP